MSKKSIPVITYAEILTRAVRTVEAEIEEWHVKCECFPEDQVEAMFAKATAELREKLDALKTLYRIEIGTDFV